jgi:hypothetical protein
MVKEKVEKFDPYTHLRRSTEYFVVDDKIVGERTVLKCRTPGETSWYVIPEDGDTFRRLTKLQHLNNYPGVNIRPGVKEQLDELKNEEEDEF